MRRPPPLGLGEAKTDQPVPPVGGTDLPGEPVLGLLMEASPFAGVVAAKLNIASKAPIEQRAKAAKVRGELFLRITIQESLRRGNLAVCLLN